MVIARNSSLLGKITILVLVGLCVNTAAALDGSGTEQDPWRIKSLEDFNDFAADANYWEDYTRLETDVNLAGLTYTTAVIAPDTNNAFDSGFNGIAFTGAFDGNYHTISNFNYTSTGKSYVGLFGYIYDPNAEIKDLVLIDPNLYAENGEYVGSLVGYLSAGTIDNCYIEGGNVSGDKYVGGLVGNGSSKIRNCCATGDVIGNRYVGGLVGYYCNGSISNCYSTGDVNGYYRVGGLVGGILVGSVSDCCSTGDVSGTFHVGGLVGANDEESNVSNCCATGDVNSVERVGGLVGFNMSDISKCYSTGNVSGDWEVGGLVGINVGSVSKCYSTGTVSGNWEVGGLVGANGDLDPGSISNCYSVGDLIGIYRVGGLVGWNYYGSASNCFSKSDVNGVERVGGLVGDNNPNSSLLNCFWDINIQTHGVTESIGYDSGTSTNVEGLPTAQMQTISTFTDANWDFINVWNIGENQTYPYLRTYLAGDINKDGIVNFLDFAITANKWLEGD